MSAGAIRVVLLAAIVAIVSENSALLLRGSPADHAHCHASGALQKFCLTSKHRCQAEILDYQAGTLQFASLLEGHVVSEMEIS